MDIKLPRLGEGVDSGIVVNILVSEGDLIKKDQTILELENEKAVAPIPSAASGKVTKIHVKEGEEITVGQVLISLTSEGPAKDKFKEAKKVNKTEGQVSPVEEPRDGGQALSHGDIYESKSGFGPPASPSIRKTAGELGIDLTRVRGSGRGGRIVLNDLTAYIQRLQQIAFQKRAPATPAPPSPTAESIDFSKWGPIRRDQITLLRRTVGKRMVKSWTTIPHITQFDDADITSLLELRKKHNPSYKTKGAHLTLTSFVLKAVTMALKTYPVFNSSLDESTGEIVYKDYCHIGVAVDTEAGLIVPVIRNVDKKGLLELSKQLQELTEKTRQRKVSLEELQGGTFTISNQGTIGSLHFTPIINKPQVAILGLGQGMAKPVARKQKVEIRTMLPLCLSYDHRVIDGADAVRFIREVVSTLEHFKEEDVKI